MKKTFLLLLLLACSCTRTLPRIGITPTEKDGVSGAQRNMGLILDTLGAQPVYLAMTSDQARIESDLSGLDGIIFLGGEDVNPLWYGEDAEPFGSNDWNDLRDSSDIYMLREAISKDIPVLAICRGAQVMNVALGGSLIQDIPSWQGRKASPENVTEILDTLQVLRVLSMDVRHGGSYHGIAVREDSKFLSQAVVDLWMDTIRSSHHQSADPLRLGSGLSVAAYSEDGIVEAIECKSCRFALGIQGHPEHDVFYVEECRKIFECFIDRCR